MSSERTLCAACGFSNEAVARFCGGCARPLTRLDAGTVPRIPSAVALTPPHLAQRILASRGAMEGERKLVTVMFADVTGSMEMISNRDPEQAQGILDAMLQEMVAAVHRYEGTVNQVLGDGLMAIFGAPIAHEDHAVRAACAALAIQDAMRTAFDTTWQDLGVQVQVRIGLNSGPVVIKAVENDLSIDYRAVGATTHLASRMEQIARPGTIRLTRHTLRLAEGLVDAEPLGRMAIKGIAEPVSVYELRRMTPGGTRFRSRITRGLTPLFGRGKEMTTLEAAVSDAAQGRGKAVLLHGEPGVGKSRLCYEVTRSEAAQAFRVLEAAASSYSRNTPYAAIVTLLGQYFGIVESESAEVLRRRMQQGASGGAPLAPEHLAILQGLLDIPGDNSLWQGLDPVQRRQRVFAAVRAIIHELCARQPLILIWEDLHWFDDDSLEFVGSLLRDLPDRALLMLLTGREAPPAPGYADALCSPLEPLPPALTEEMLRTLIGDSPELAKLRGLLATRTYGNPFFVEETVRSLVESGVLIGKPGAYTLRDPDPGIDIPPTAAGLIAARIDGLPPEVKSLMQTAAVVGNEMAVDVLRRVSGLQDPEFARCLSAAADSGLMYEVQNFPDTLCGFRHALNQEVAYGSLLSARRKQLHGRVVEVFEEIYRERLSEHVERLADHSFRAEMWNSSVRYHIMAASRAASRFANHEAVQILDRGLRVMERLDPGQARSEAAIDLRLAGLAALLPLGEQERILSTLFEAEAIAASIGDPRRLAAVHSQISAALWMAGQHDRARECAERALVIAEAQKQFGLGMTARFGLVTAHHALGDLGRARDLARGLLADLAGDRELKRFGWAAYPSVVCRVFLGSALALTGEFDEAIRCHERGVALADQTLHPYSRALARHELGTAQLMRGDPAQALATLSNALDIAREGEVRTMYAPLAGWLGAALAELGRPQEAIDAIEAVMGTHTERVAGHYARYFMLDGLANAYARLGRHGEALSRAEEAVDRTLVTHEFVHHGHALLRLASVHAGRGSAFHDAAESHYRKALECARRHAMRPLEADCLEGLGRLQAQRGRLAEARTEMQAAAVLYDAVHLASRARLTREASARMRA